MAFEAIGILHWNDYSEIKPNPFSVVEPDFIAACARAHEEAGFETLFGCQEIHFF